MAKRTLFLIIVCLGLALTLPAEPVRAGKKKELAFAVSLARKGLWREATYRFEALVRKNPYNARLWNNLGVSYESSGRWEKANHAYDEAARLADRKLEELELNRAGFAAFYSVWKAKQERQEASATAPADDESGQDNPPPDDPDEGRSP